MDFETGQTQPTFTTCIICFDEDFVGLQCEHNHMLCRKCIAPYIQSVICNTGKLKDQGYCIRCPAVTAGVQCRASPWRAAELCTLASNSVDNYVQTLVYTCERNTSHDGGNAAVTEGVVPLLLDALNLRCPNAACRVVLDPSPDGCCAIRCGSCASYSCALCFSICMDGPACHQHVMSCRASPDPGNIFVSEQAKIPAMRRLRVMALRNALATPILHGTDRTAVFLNMPGSTEDSATTASNEVGKQLSKHTSAKEVLRTIKKELSDLHITADDVFHLNVAVVPRRSFWLQYDHEMARLREWDQRRIQRMKRLQQAALCALVVIFAIALMVVATEYNTQAEEENQLPTAVYDTCAEGPTAHMYECLASAFHAQAIAGGLECVDCDDFEPTWSLAWMLEVLWDWDWGWDVRWLLWNRCSFGWFIIAGRCALEASGWADELPLFEEPV